MVALGIICAAIALLALGRVVGRDPTWRAFGVTPLQPPFFDIHDINDYAACAWKGVDAYAPQACNIDNFNIPPTWLWLGFLGIDPIVRPLEALTLYEVAGLSALLVTLRA